jgi:MFS family permease
MIRGCKDPFAVSSLREEALVRTVRQWLDQTAGGLPRQFWYLWLNSLINRAGSFVIILLAIYLTTQREFSAAYAGLVLGLWGAGGAVGTLVGGVLADRWGRKQTMLTALYGAAGAMLLLAAVRGPVEVAVTVALLGLLNEASRPAISALMVDIVPVRDRLRAFSLNYWAINLGFSLAALTAGVLAGVDFLLVFAVNAVAVAVAATIVAVRVRNPVRSTLTVAGPVRPAGIRTVFADRVFLGFVVLNVLTAIIMMQHMSTLPMSMTRDGLSPATYGTVMAINGVMIVAGQLFVPRLLRRMRTSTALAVAVAVMGTGFGLTAFADSVWRYAFTVAVWTVGEMFQSPSNASTNAELAPAALRGRYQGVFSLSWSVATFTAPILGGAVLQYAGDTALWFGCFGLGLVVAALHLRSGPARERRAHELRTSAAQATVDPVAADAGAGADPTRT